MKLQIQMEIHGQKKNKKQEKMRRNPMTRKTKKVGTTGSFGPRYGSQLKKRYLKIENSTNAKHKCPNCASSKVKRQSVGIWMCKKCGLSFAGGAWIPTTPTGKTALRTAASLQEQELEKSKK